MARPGKILLLIFLIFMVLRISAQNPIVAISGYFNQSAPEDEWSELIVVGDNVDMRGWTFGDNNQSQTNWQTEITFNSIPLWNNLRAGTIIIIWHRVLDPVGGTHVKDDNKTDGYIQVAANDPTYFTGGSWPSNTLNISGTGDLERLRNSTGTYIHALGHRQPVGSSWAQCTCPRLNHASQLANGEAVFVCPGTNIDQYGTTPPQDGTTWTAKSNSATTFGLPNTCSASTTANSDFWRSLRQPGWTAPTLTGSVDANNTAVTLNWNACTDPNPGDASTGYILLRNTTNTFTDPVDGHTYNAGDLLGGATVLALIPSSQTITYTDNTPVPCTDGFYYRIYAYRYSTDNLNGNDYNLARGRAYNQANFGNVNVTYPTAVEPTSASSDRDNFCADDPGNITLSAPGGSGNVLNWYEGSCGGTLLGPGSGANNSITIPSPAVTTTYYARWENACGNSPCVSVTVTVLPNLPVSVSITASENPVCEGTFVTFTATPANGGTNPAYQWVVNGANVGTGTNTYSYIPSNGDDISVVLNSNEQCTSGNPATSNHIIMTVLPSMPVSVIVNVAPNDTVCVGTAVTFTAVGVNPGTGPVYQWFLNGAPVATGSTYTYTPTDGDVVYCQLTSNEPCATNNPANSNSFIMEVVSDLPVSVTINASPGNVICIGTTVTYTATPVNGGSMPEYQWYVNGAPVGTDSPTYSHIPNDGDQVYCTLNSSELCATGNPATSNTITITVTDFLPVSVTITAGTAGSVVCAGSVVTITANPVNGGSSPGFEWFLNGSPVGTNSISYTYVPMDGDNVYCILTSSESCATGNPATSNVVTFTVNQVNQVSLSISALPGTNICAGTTVTYTALPVNEGTAPAYQWYLNDNPVGGGGPTWSNVPVDGDEIYCVLTSNINCPSGNPATSNKLTITISALLPVSITISAAPGTAVCEGFPVNVTAAAINGGTVPLYEWFLNAIAVGTSSPVYTFIPDDGDVLSCRVTSDLTCATGNPATSNSLSFSTTPPLPVSISITASPGVVICPGDMVTFTATPVNEGAAPVLQWFVNGIPSGGNGPTYTTTPADGDVFTCSLTVSETCVTNNPATSNSLTISYSTATVASVSVVPDRPEICTGATVRFSATPVNGGTLPSYQWLVDGVSMQQGNSPDFTTSSVSPGQEVICRMTSDLPCLAVNPVESSPLILTQAPPPVVSISDQEYLCVGRPETLDPGPGFIAYLWQDGSTSRTYTATLEGIYWVVVTDSLHCTNSDSVPMVVCAGYFYLPNAFTPNGDGNNDRFSVSTNQENITAFSFLIYSRWGQLVFETNDFRTGWDGKINGSPAPAETYAWKIVFKVGSEGKETIMHGTVTIVN